MQRNKLKFQYRFTTSPYFDSRNTIPAHSFYFPQPASRSAGEKPACTKIPKIIPASSTAHALWGSNSKSVSHSLAVRLVQEEDGQRNPEETDREHAVPGPDGTLAPFQIDSGVEGVYRRKRTHRPPDTCARQEKQPLGRKGEMPHYVIRCHRQRQGGRERVDHHLYFTFYSFTDRAFLSS
ncbi:hypothetical protein CDAR_28251 [Caerostris darwini]|uniref:Uncharacterized protein n=1 Tax=Caerostris darwini TaxID=1538125 RepID=A0AAV4UR57_9ARAC|nr:hypothetical protein CDAR_28251 [Caerostris darwini]